MRRRIKVISLGGTIAMRAANGGLEPALKADDLAGAFTRALPDLEISTLDLATVASANVGFALLKALCAEITRLKAEGYFGVVVTQGTDTLEESAFAVEVMAPAALPIVFTGAMRGASALSPDGPANLFGALTYLASPQAAPEVVVILNDEVHAARHVRKAHTTSLSAFSSGERGLRGRIHEGRFRPFRPAPPVLAPVGSDLSLPPPPVWIATLGLDPDEGLFTCGASQGVAGWVIAALGAGHVPERLVPTLERLAADAPVVLCTRTGQGAICESTYAYAGSEMDLLARGLIPGGDLSPLKARVLLSLLLADGRDAVRARLAEYTRTD